MGIVIPIRQFSVSGQEGEGVRGRHRRHGLLDLRLQHLVATSHLQRSKKVAHQGISLRQSPRRIGNDKVIILVTKKRIRKRIMKFVLNIICSAFNNIETDFNALHQS